MQPASIPQVAEMNTRQLLDAILRGGPVSRAQLARDTGLSKPTVSLALARLEAAGLVGPTGRTSGGRGATAVLYDVEPAAGYALAMDVGRQWMRAAVLIWRVTGSPRRSTGPGRAACPWPSN